MSTLVDTDIPPVCLIVDVVDQMLCPLTGFQTIAAVYLQAVGKPVKSAVLSLARQIIFFVPAALILPTFLGVEGVLWTGPVADGLAFLLSLALLLYERHHLKKGHARQLSAGQCETA